MVGWTHYEEGSNPYEATSVAVPIDGGVGADLVAFALSERQRSAVTSLDLTDNRLSGAGAVALGAARNGCWLRELVLTAHPTRPERARWG